MRFIRERNNLGKLRSFLLAAVLLSLALVAAACQPISPAQTTTPPGTIAAVHFLDVGQGDSIFIQTEAQTVLIDGGEAEYGDKVVQYLHRQGVKRIDLLIGTHPHSDHIGGLLEVLKELPVGRVIDASVAHTSKNYLDYLTLIDEQNIEFTEVKDEEITLGEHCQLLIYQPADEFDDLNNNSVVAKLVAGKVSVLLTGDMEAKAEAALLPRHDLQSTVLKVAHHGSSTSSSQAFLEEVTPEAAIISLGADNSYGHPHAEVLNALSGVTLYRTDLHGTVVMHTDGEEYRFQAERQDGLTAKLQARASISDATPEQNSEVTAFVAATRGTAPVAGAQVTIECEYKSTTSVYKGVTGADGVAEIPFRIGRAAKGYPVIVTAKVQHAGDTVFAETSFTPK